MKDLKIINKPKTTTITIENSEYCPIALIEIVNDGVDQVVVKRKGKWEVLK